MPTAQEWIADGTPTAAPVTTETPVIETPVEATPVVAAEPAAPATAESVATDATAAATAAGATPAEAAAAGAQAAQDFIEGRLGDQPFQIPKGLQIPWKRGNETGFESIEEVQRRGMFERDYRIKTSELAAQRRQMEIDSRVQAARNEALRKAYEEQQERVKAAYASPEEQARHEAFLNQYRDDPHFRKIVDDAQKGRVLEAERAALTEYENEQATVDMAQQVSHAIDQIGQNYPDVDPSFVRQRYAEALQNDTMPLSAAAIESLFKQEAARVAAYRGPLQRELEALRADLASLRTGQAAEAHNTTTRTAMARAASPVAAPIGGTPPAPVAPAANLQGRTLHDRSREWGKLR